MLFVTSFVLNFAYAELQEAKKDFPEVHAAYDKFIIVLRADLEALEARVNSANSSMSTIGSQPPALPPPPLSGSLAIGAELEVNSANSSFATQVAEDRPPKSKELAERQSEYTLVWIMYMRFGRRAEGIKTSRTVFARARKERLVTWEIFEAAGLGYFCSLYVHIR